MMSDERIYICFQCLKEKGDYKVCPFCGHAETTRAKQAYHLPVGDRLCDGRYIMGPSIGDGGFGITYKAFDTSLKAVRAVKEFYPQGLVNRGEGERKVGIFLGEKEGEYKRRLSRFKDEARNLAQFTEEKEIIKVYDRFEENETAYIIMEYVDAPLFRDYLKEKGKLTIEEATGYMMAVLDALSKIHSKDIIHKDISPDNMFRIDSHTIKLFDFGAAKFSGSQNERSDDVVVKPGYTPLEQYGEKKDLGKSVDIYAAGAIFYQMITGEKPPDAPDRLDKNNKIKRFREFGIKGNRWLESILFKAMAMDPKMRFQTAEEFRDAIKSKKHVFIREDTRATAQKMLMAGGAVAIIASAAIVLKAIFSSDRNRIKVEDIQEDQLEMWLEAVDIDTGRELSQILLERVKEECPQLTISVEVMAEDEYVKKLAQAVSEDNLPDIFCTDSLNPSYYCEELSGLMQAMDWPPCLYLSDLEKEEIYGVPTAVQVGVLYVNENKTEDFPEWIEIDDLERQGDMLGYADDENVFAEFQNASGSVSCIAGDLSVLRKVEEVTVEAVPPTGFSALPILKEGKLAAVMKKQYGIHKGVTENQKKAGIYLLSLMLNGQAQSAAYMNNTDGIPLNREAMDVYLENKMTTYLSALKEYKLEEAEIYEGNDICQVIREGSGDEE